MAILFVPMLVAGFVMMFKNPELLKKRLNAKEEQKEQGFVVKISALMFATGFILAGLGFRFEWYVLPDPVVFCATLVFLVSYALYAEVIRENPYLSRTIEIQEKQKVISGGLYSIVRHPMYTVTLLMFLAMPLVLGSIYAFFVFLIYPFVIVIRIRNEEKILMQGLEGYTDYMKKVRYRLIPFVW